MFSLQSWAGLRELRFLQQPQHTQGKPLEESPATHVSGYFFSPAPPRLVSGSAFCGKTPGLCFAPWWHLEVLARVCAARGAWHTLLKFEITFRKGEERGPLEPLAGKIKSDFHVGGKASSQRRSSLDSTPSPAPCLVLSSPSHMHV